MLQSLHVKNLALIDEIEIEFGPGLNILTGETGAGKSIILGSVNLALGGRYSRDILRKGTRYGFTELTFLIEDEKQMKKLEEMDIFPEEGRVVLGRRLMEGKSVSRINGETVTMAQLKKVADILIDIHGQHEHQSLLYKKNQLAILDAFAKEKIKTEADAVRTSFKEYKKCLEEWEKSTMDETERMKESDFLSFEIQEIREAQLVEGEDEELESAYRKMQNARKIVENGCEAYEYTKESSELISRAIRSLNEVSRFDKKAEEICGQLMDADGILNDFNRELSDYNGSLEFSEEEFRKTEERLNTINRLKAKYGSALDEIEKVCEEKEARLQLLQDYDLHMLELEKKKDLLHEQLRKHTEQLTKQRKAQAKILEKSICEGLKDLNFADVKFQIAFEPLKEFTANGGDDVEFLISLNPGEEVKPLAQVASGGELSRIMLAIKAVMADKDEIETLIFDEIDVGISGRTAQKVSEKMAVIGRGHQIICITHLAQIAAMADQHFAIEKSVEENVTRSRIRLLSEEEEIEELARILGGASITETVRQNAREMKSLAESKK